MKLVHIVSETEYANLVLIQISTLALIGATALGLYLAAAWQDRRRK
jgi:hypothetical protein